MTAADSKMTSIMLYTEEGTMKWFTTATARAGPGLVAAAMMGLLALGPQLPPPAHSGYPLLPVVVSASSVAAGQSASQAVVRSGGTLNRRLSLIDGFAALVPAWALKPLLQLPGIR